MEIEKLEPGYYVGPRYKANKNSQKIIFELISIEDTETLDESTVVKFRSMLRSKHPVETDAGTFSERMIRPVTDKEKEGVKKGRFIIEEDALPNGLQSHDKQKGSYKPMSLEEIYDDLLVKW